MNMFSLRTIIDDILLIVRNNNISESEDLSRAQIASWILAYRAALIKARRDQEKNNLEDDETSLNMLLETKGPIELELEQSKDGTLLFRKKTKTKIPELVDKDQSNLFSVHDQIGNPIQFMSEERKFFHRFRKYTKGEFTYNYENGYIIIHGSDIAHLNYIWIEGLFSDEDSSDINEDDYKIPGWMIPDIKKNILQTELSFMLQRISDDDNNSTLDGIKPQPQAVQPNEK